MGKSGQNCGRAHILKCNRFLVIFLPLVSNLFFLPAALRWKKNQLKKKNFSICRNIFLKEKLSGKNPSFFFDLRDLVFRPKKFSRLRCLFVIFFRDLFFIPKNFSLLALISFFFKTFFFWPQVKCCACGA